MTFDEFMTTVLELFPTGTVGEDNDGQLTIYTGLQRNAQGVTAFEAVATRENVVEALVACGHDANVGICGPTDVEINLTEGRILLAKDFNTTGWEAVYELDDEQTPLVDGPGSNYSPVTDVVEWAEALINDWKANVA